MKSAEVKQSRFELRLSVEDRLFFEKVSAISGFNTFSSFVLIDESNDVKSYYTLSNSSISQVDISKEFSRRLPNSYSNIPVTLLGRLAIDKSVFGQGQGEYLLMDALKESCSVSKKVIGSIAVIVYPIDAEAISFYKKYDFILLPNSGKMFLSMNTISKLFPDI